MNTYIPTYSEVMRRIETHEDYESVLRTYGAECFEGKEIGPEWVEIQLRTDEVWESNPPEAVAWWARFRALPGGQYEVTGWIQEAFYTS
jgi:hypothetical protein